MWGKKSLSIFSKMITALLIIILVLFAAFLTGRYGWKLGGFNACQTAGIESVEVTDGEVRITGFDPGPFPTGFLGYHAQEKDGALYVGFKYSFLFGIFEPADFDVSIPVQGEIRTVVMKSRHNEYPIWPQ